MNNSDIEEVYKKLLQEETALYFKTIKNDLQNILRDVENRMIYQYYTPTTYRRTGYFLDSVKLNIDEKEGTAFLYNDMNEGSPYISAVDGSPQFIHIPYWLENGHDDGIGINEQKENQYHRYEGRHYLEEVKKEIESKYKDLNIKIINEDDNDILYNLDYF